MEPGVQGLISMQVRIPMKAGVRPRKTREADRAAAGLVSGLCGPVMLIGYLMAGWRLLYELRWGHKFGIDDGIWSHWQVWGAIAVVSHLLWSRLARHADGGQPSPRPYMMGCDLAPSLPHDGRPTGPHLRAPMELESGHAQRPAASDGVLFYESLGGLPRRVDRLSGGI